MVATARIVTRLCAGQSWVQSLAVTKDSLFSQMCRPAPSTTHPPIQWVLGALPVHVKQPKHEVDHSPPHSTSIKNVKSIVGFLFHGSF